MGVLSCFREFGARTRRVGQLLVGLSLCSCLPVAAQEVAGVPGWQVREPTPGTHRVCTEIGGALAGRGSVKITGFTNEENARLSLVQEFRRETALPTGKVYRYAFA